jgi:hypothetical protein
MLVNLTKDTPLVISQQSPQNAVLPVPRPPSSNRPNSTQAEQDTSTTIPYLGESSFEVHSQQTSKILEKALSNTPPTNFHSDDTSSALQSIQKLLKEKTSHPPMSFAHDLPMVPIQTALRALRLVDGK